MATGLAAEGGLCGGLAGVWAKDACCVTVEAAIVASAPASTQGTNCFMDANLSGGRLYCNKRRTPHGYGECGSDGIGAAGQGDAEVGRGVRLLRRPRGGRVLDQGPSPVRHAASA